ncbi:hypothetical protein, partial [Streptomyces cinereoruber]|uniref:hypothetical protein n=1 Tax=Streptomyces cinereoruber TaxID=67260 RepID=UPI00362E5BF1
MELVVPDDGVGEGEREGAVGLAGGALAGDAVLLGLVARGGVRGGRAVELGVRPQDVAFDAVLAAGPAEGAGGVVRGGEVAEGLPPGEWTPSIGPMRVVVKESFMVMKVYSSE